MSIESKAMKIVEDVLGKDDLNGFFSGTLFVCCFPGDANSLLRKLNKEFDGKVRMSASKCHMEYSYDFVA